MYGPGPGQGYETTSDLSASGGGAWARDGPPDVQVVVEVLVVGERVLVVVEVVIVGMRIFMKYTKSSEAPCMKCGCLEAAVGPHVGLVRCVVVARGWKLCDGTDVRTFGECKKMSSVVG